MHAKSLPASALYRHCDPDKFHFKTTDELEDTQEIVGQKRAIDALHFGMTIRREGFNLYVMGPAGIGKFTAIKRYLDQEAAAHPIPSDWVYVNNFADSDKPRVLRLPAGRGRQLSKDVEQLIEDLRHAMPMAFESAEYHSRVEEIKEAVGTQREKALEEVAADAQRQRVQLTRTRRGFAFEPQKDDGTVLPPEEFEKLPEAERHKIEKIVAELQDKLTKILLQMPKWQREARDEITKINRDIAIVAVGGLISELQRDYADVPSVQEYLSAVQAQIVDHADDFLQEEDSGAFVLKLGAEGAVFRRYHVHVVVDNSETTGAPVVYEDNPTFDRLVGRVEYRAHLGALLTDFTMIKPGALHRANGGFLILDIRKLLGQPYAWEGLKRALKAQEISIQSLGQVFSLISTTGLDPEPIPLDIKVILVGDRELFYLLIEYDPEFAEQFKVAADFDETIDRTPENDMNYARLIATIARKDQLLPFDRDAVCRVIEHGSRLAADAEKVSTYMLHVADLLREADHWARAKGRRSVAAEHVKHALVVAEQRQDRLRNRLYEEIQRGTIGIQTRGEQVGQVNGLSVVELGTYRFAHPFRITATARLGEGEVIDIEREAELGGAIHSKGVLTLSSFMASRYAPTHPLSLSASLVIEQSYGGVEGDSASVAELCALLSVLANAPIQQSLAITGAVDQMGRVQAIGGVNEKIEGFFEVCQLCGLNGQQGVVIPSTNVKHLMLKDEVVEAVAAGKFHIYTAETVDEAIELLTGQIAGQRDEKGEFPEGSINSRVEQHLAELAMLRHEFGRPGSESLADAAEGESATDRNEKPQ